ncbi:MAG: hypothetical protein KAQ89_02730 [Planctomycetes bacterium]|nr:hypothetical protein [Planctomycetota bacterium]
MKLNKKQLTLIEDLFAGEIDEKQIIEKNKITKNTYNKWLADENFTAEIARRIAVARLQSKLLIARFSLAAAAKLVQLTESEKEETARRACLDIIAFPDSAGEKQAQKHGDENGDSQSQLDFTLTEKAAEKLLTALCEE